MTEKAQRYALAKFCGFRRDNPNVGPSHEKMWGWWMPSGTFFVGDGLLPDFLKDLNAIRIAVLHLSDDQVNRFDTMLWNECMGATGRHGAIHAPCSQRARVLLKVINEWIETPPFEIEADKLTIGKKTGPLKL